MSPLRHAGRAVADGAMRREMLGADRGVRGIVETRAGPDAGRMRLDRADAGGFHHPVVTGQCGAVAATS